MNNKLLAVVGSATVAAAFWACGSGEIYEPTENDQMIQMTGTAKGLCPDGCDGAFDVESSSSSEEELPFVSSSSDMFGPNDDLSFEIASSSSFEFVPSDGSSASGGTPVTGLGSCAPMASPVDKNKAGAAQFKFTRNTESSYSVTQLASAKLEWDYGPNSTEVTPGKSTTSGTVTYSLSGQVIASVKVPMLDGAEETIQCSPLQVKGDPITGCTCATAAASVDFTATPDVAWTVSGCTSASDQFTYTWDGVEGQTSFTKTFTAATAAYAPTLKVGNNDKTVIDVTCPAVKVTEGAEYTIAKSQDKVVFEAAGSYAVVVSGGTGLTACRISCNANGPLTIKADAIKADAKTFTGSYYVNWEGIDVSWCNKTIALEISAAATCEASWN